MRQLVAVVGTLLVLGVSTFAQTSAGERAAALRQQVSENEAQQAALKSRLEVLDEAMKPENIEKSLAGVGSTKPEDEREQKRKQFEIERKGVQTKLDLLIAGRTRLETSLGTAEADAYRESAGVGPTGAVTAPVTTPAPAPETKQATTTPAPSVKPVRRTRRQRTRPRRTSQNQEFQKPLSTNFQSAIEKMSDNL